MNGLEGKTALVTGGAGGIGSMICEALLESRCRVVLHDLPTSEGAAKTRSFCDRFGAGRAIFAPGDLDDLPVLKREAEALVVAAGGFDFLVNNAAIDPVAPIEAYSLEEFLAVQSINAHALFVLCQTLAPSMKRKGGGAIVNITSIQLSGGGPEKGSPMSCRKGHCWGSRGRWPVNSVLIVFESTPSAPAQFRRNSSASTMRATARPSIGE